MEEMPSEARTDPSEPSEALEAISDRLIYDCVIQGLRKALDAGNITTAEAVSYATAYENTLTPTKKPQ